MYALVFNVISAVVRFFNPQREGAGLHRRGRPWTYYVTQRQYVREMIGARTTWERFHWWSHA